MAQRTCTVIEDGKKCERPHVARGLCRPHYGRWKRNRTDGPQCIVVEDGVGCEGVVRTRNMCTKHYSRWRRHGDPLVGGKRQTSDKCSVIENGQECGAEAKARDMCSMHYRRWSRYGDPTVVLPTPPPPIFTGPEHYKWTGDEVGYEPMHRRVAQKRGKAKEHTCVECGDPASAWAYLNQCPDEKHSDGRGAFCIHTEHYAPMCFLCHRLFDYLFAHLSEKKDPALVARMVERMIDPPLAA